MRTVEHSVLAILSFLVLDSPSLAQPVPSILGSYEGSHSAISYECPDPEDDDQFFLLGEVTVFNQTPTADPAQDYFEASGLLTGGGDDFTIEMNLTMTGTVDREADMVGNYGYTLTLVGFGEIATGAGQFTGRAGDRRFSFWMTGTESYFGDPPCTYRAEFSGCPLAPCADLRENWRSHESAPHDKPDALIGTPEGGWLVGDTVSEFPADCGPVVNRARIVPFSGSDALRLSSRDSGSDCSDNIWAVLPGLRIPILERTVLSFQEVGELIDPQSGSLGCLVLPCGDTISLLLQDNRGNVLAYVLQRAPDAVPNDSHSTYREIFLDTSLVSHTRNLLDDFQTIPAFNPVDAELSSTEFKIQEHGEATIDVLVVEQDNSLCFDIDGDGNVDNDGDALCDSWERDGIDANADGIIDSNDYLLPGADPNHKDIYVEIDWMQDHEPDDTAIADVVASFANAPVSNPDNLPGIDLHLRKDEMATAHAPNFSFPADFDTLKQSSFGTAQEWQRPNAAEILAAKALAFHYALFVHDRTGLAGQSGVAELGGNDLMISLGSFRPWNGHNGAGDPAQQASTVMHELGHNLGLRHGGADGANCKPNYLSVMTYVRQNPYGAVQSDPNKLDYSRAALSLLNEDAALDESSGIGGPSGYWTAYGPPQSSLPPVAPPAQAVHLGPHWVVVSPADQPLDWNRDGDSVDTGVSADINDFGFDGCQAGVDTALRGHDDWSNLIYSFRYDEENADGVHLDLPVEMTLDNALALSPDSDGDGVRDVEDNCLEADNPSQFDADLDGFGDLCDCAPNDVMAFAVPRQIVGVVFGAGKERLSWQSDSGHSGSGTAYDIVRGQIASLPVGADPATVCVADDRSDTMVQDTDVPLPGTGYYYLVRGANSCGAGTYGEESSSVERISTACP